MENIINQVNLSELEVEKRKKKEKVLKILKNILVYSFLTVVAFMSILPFYWMIIT